MDAATLTAPTKKPLAASANGHTAHRVSRADLDEMGAWLADRIVQRHPYKTKEAVFSWLLGAQTQNDQLFVRAGEAVALVQLHKAFLPAHPWCETIFCLAREGCEGDASGLFQDIRSWGEHHGCTHVVINEPLCDAQRADIALEIGSVKQDRQSIVRFPLYFAAEG